MLNFRKSLVHKIIFWFVITTIIPIIIASVLTLNLATDTLVKENFSKLDSIAKLKINSINSVFGEIESDTIIAQKYFNVRKNLPILANYHADMNHPDYQSAKKQLDEQFFGYLQEKTLVDKIILLDSEGMLIYQNGNVQSKWFSTPFPVIDSSVLESAKKGQKFTKIFLNESYKNEATIFSLISINDLNDEFVGYFILDLNMRQIFELIEDKTGLGNTGETLLGIEENNFAMFINPLKYDKNASFVKKIALDDEIALPIRDSVQGKDGHGLTLDYRSEPIIAVWKHIPSLDWGIVAKIDQTEAFSSINSLKQSSALLAIIFTIVVGIIGFLMARNIVVPILSLINNIEKIGRGIFDDVIKVKGKDELSLVTQSFNKMSQDLHDSNKNLQDFKSGLDKSAIVAITNIDGTITYANQKFCEISKYSEKELLGKNHNILKSGYHSKKFYKELWDTITNGNTWFGEIKNRAKDGSDYWVNTMIMPIRNKKDNQISQFLSIRTDVTSQKDLTQQLVHAEKLSSIGELGSRLAHDVRNPLHVIQLSLDNIKEKEGMTDSEKQSLERIQRSMSRITHQINNVLDFVRTPIPEFNHVKISEIIAESIESLRIPKNITLITPKNNVELLCDKKLFSVAINNLILNSIQAINGTGKIEISCKENDEVITLEIKDSGKGISQNDINHVFEPLFTTKMQGTGLGLSSVKSIIESHDGVISVTSPPTVFTITLPKRN